MAEEDDPIEAEGSPQCFFCSVITDPEDSDAVMYLTLIENYDDEAAIEVVKGWACHRACVRAARHPDVPEWWERER